MSLGCCGDPKNRPAGSPEDPGVVGEKVDGDPVVRVQLLLNNVIPGFASGEVIWATGTRVASLIAANHLRVVDGVKV